MAEGQKPDLLHGDKGYTAWPASQNRACKAKAGLPLSSSERQYWIPLSVRREQAVGTRNGRSAGRAGQKVELSPQRLRRALAGIKMPGERYPANQAKLVGR